MRYFCDHDDERLLAMVRLAEEQGGVLAIKLDDLTDMLNMPRQAIMRRARWGELYGLWAVKKSGGRFGEGRTPNEYHLLMSLEEWMQRGPDIVHEVHTAIYNRRAKKAWEGPRKKPMPKPKPRVDEAWQRIQAQAKAEVAEAIKNGNRLPPITLPRITEDELNAWAAFDEATAD